MRRRIGKVLWQVGRGRTIEVGNGNYQGRYLGLARFSSSHNHQECPNTDSAEKVTIGAQEKLSSGNSVEN